MMASSDGTLSVEVEMPPAASDGPAPIRSPKGEAGRWQHPGPEAEGGDECDDMVTRPLNPRPPGLLSPEASQLERLQRATRALCWVASCGLLLALVVSGAVAALYGMGGLECEWAESRATRVHAPRLLLISFDGFRFDYIDRAQVQAQWLRKFRGEGTHAARMLPVYPSKTFPNHYSIVTGLYPPWHGVVDNGFCYKDWAPCFSMQNKEPRYWLGEPIWQTAALQGLPATTAFWPGSEVPKPGWPCDDPAVCLPYHGASEGRACHNPKP
mmetsp:Transcript_4269/g.13626  ORF Transcript_4269/g.13626 Transcript_4269/m.13626 type:complete len:269 (+) Transcript_4269:208-1014(+)